MNPSLVKLALLGTDTQSPDFNDRRLDPFVDVFTNSENSAAKNVALAIGVETLIDQATPGKVTDNGENLFLLHDGDGGEFLPSDVADARMRILNSDGSEAEMCGNGLRCLGKFLYDTGLCKQTRLRVETLAGILALDMETGADGAVQSVTVDMGAPTFEPARIPVASEANAFTLDVTGHSLRFFCVGMGNPHAVTFDLFPDDETFAALGPLLERHPVFPRRCNIEFCRVEDDGVRVRVWERGDGPTLACGTGACAVLAAGASQGLLPRRAPVHLPGGTGRLRYETGAQFHPELSPGFLINAFYENTLTPQLNTRL